jgi:hypothetical protein
MMRLRRLTRLILGAAAQTPSRCPRAAQNLPSRHDPISFGRNRDRLRLSPRGPAPSRRVLPKLRLPLASHLPSNSPLARRFTPIRPLARPSFTKADRRPRSRRHITPGNPATHRHRHRRITSPPRHNRRHWRRCSRLIPLTCRRRIRPRRGIKTTALRATRAHTPHRRRCRITPRCQSRGRRGTRRPTRNRRGHSKGAGTIPTRWPRHISPRRVSP